MAEVAELIIGSIPPDLSVNQLRIIQLRHSMAQDVVNVFMQAIGKRRAGSRRVRREAGFGQGGQFRQGGAQNGRKANSARPCSFPHVRAKDEI